MSDSHITDEMAALVGRDYQRLVSFPVSASDIRRWAIAVYYPEPPPPKFWDAEAAARGRDGGVVAPEDFNPFAWMVAETYEEVSGVDPNDPDAVEKRLGVAGPGLKHQLNGGLSASYGVPMRPGDVITSVSRVAEYRERRGRLGLMLFTSTEEHWTNQDGEFVRRFTMDLIRY